MQTRVSRQNPHGHSGSVHDCSGRQLRAFFQVEEHLGDHARQPLGSMQGAHIGGQIGMDDALGAVEVEELRIGPGAHRDCHGARSAGPSAEQDRQLGRRLAEPGALRHGHAGHRGLLRQEL